MIVFSSSALSIGMLFHEFRRGRQQRAVGTGHSEFHRFRLDVGPAQKIAQPRAAPAGISHGTDAPFHARNVRAEQAAPAALMGIFQLAAV
jgi:hypothetical protein